jgi:hypothetical protein
MLELVMALALISPAFSHNGAIPKIYTCQGRDISPVLAWSGLPEGTQSLALIVDDPDAPDPATPKMTWVHWVLYNIPPGASGLQEAIALDAVLPDLKQPTKAALEKAMQGHVLAKVELMGTYQKD